MADHLPGTPGAADDAARYRRLFEDAGIGLAHLAPDGTIHEANRAFGHLLGRDAAALDGHPCTAFLHPADAPLLIALAEQLRREGLASGRCELRWVRPDESLRWAGTILSALRDADGRFGGILVQARDITAHRELEQRRGDIERQLRESEEAFRSAFDDAGLGMALVARDGRNLRVNRALSAILGYTEAELLAITWKDVVHPDDLDASLLNWERFDRREAEAVTSRKRYFHKDGHEIWVEVTISMVRDDADRPMHFLAQVRDVTPERALAEALQDSEARFRSAFESSVIGLAILSTDGRTLQVNGAVARMLGYKDPAELAAARWTDLIHPDELADAQANIARVIRGELDSTRAARRYRRRDGGEVRLEVTTSAVRDAGGTVTALYIQAEDVSERERLNAARAEMEERLTLVLDAVQDGIWDWDVRSGEAWYGPQWFAMLGLPAEGRRAGPELFRSLVHPDDAPSVWAANERQIHDRGAGPYDERFRMRRADGTWAWIRSRGRVIARDAAGRATRMVGTHTDVSAEVEAEAARAASEERLRLVIDALEDGIWDHDLVTGVGYASPRYFSMLGYPPRAQATYEDFLALVHPDDRDAILAANAQQVADPHAEPYDLVGRLRRADGSWAWIRMRGRVVERDADGRALRAIGTHSDVTALRELEEQYRQASKMEAIGNLAGGIAHDFNNLLTTISATTAILRDDLPPDAPQRTDLEQVARAADRAAALTRQLLAFSRREVERHQVVGLDATVTAIAPLLERALQPGQVLAVLPGAPDAAVRLDPAQLELALLNLVVNARDAMPGGGTITVRTAPVAEDPGMVALTVADTGIGIPPELRERIFDPFFTTKPQGKGTGLGLTTVYGFVQALGGGVTLDSTPGQGTRFTLRLPRFSGTAPAAAPAPRAAAPEAAAGRTVLVVDDEAMVRGTTSRLLQRRGYRVLEADGAEAALAILAAGADSVHVVLSDHAMPGRTGRELLEEVRDRWPALRVVLMSGYAGDDAVREEIAERGLAFLGKPFTLEELVRAVEG